MELQAVQHNKISVINNPYKKKTPTVSQYEIHVYEKKIN